MQVPLFPSVACLPLYLPRGNRQGQKRNLFQANSDLTNCIIVEHGSRRQIVISRGGSHRIVQKTSDHLAAACL